MDRRNFLALAASTSIAANTGYASESNSISFKDKLCINESTSMAHDFDVCMEGYAKAGIRHVEPWIHKIRPFVEKESIATARKVLTDNGLSAPSSCCMGELIEPRDDHSKKIEQLKATLEIIKEMGIERFVVHSFTGEQYTLDDYKKGVDHVRELGEIGQEFGVVINIEFIRMQRFMGTLPTALSLARKANHPYVQVLFDFYHFWAGQGKMQDLELLREGEPGHVHFHDAPDWPREILRDADRVLPGAGVAPMKEMVEILRRKKYQGYFSVELFNKEIQKADPCETAKRIIAASEPFLT